MRIAFWVRAGSKYGGLEKYIALFADICKDRGHEFLLLNEIENDSNEYHARLDNAGATEIVVGESSNKRCRVFSKVIHLLRNWKPDIVDLHFIDSLAVPILRIAGVSLVYHTYHSGIDHSISLRTRFLRSLDNIFAKSVIAVSERVRQDEIKAGIKPSHIQTIFLGVPINSSESIDHSLQGCRPIGWDDPHLKKVITVGRFSPVKGMRLVVETATQILPHRNDIVWWLLGKEGSESDICNTLIQASKLENRIDVLGQRNDVTGLMKECYVHVVGSQSEGLPLAVLEAGASGVPTIGPQIRGLDEAIIDGVTGILVEEGTSQKLADATSWLLDRPDERTRMGAAAKEYVEAKFNSELLINRLLDQFEFDYSTGNKK